MIVVGVSREELNNKVVILIKGSFDTTWLPSRLRR